jgi:hypothetical protein
MMKVEQSQSELVDRLEVLLGSQRDSIAAGDLNQCELISGQVDVVVRELAKVGFDISVLNGERKEKLQKIYQGMCMALETEKTDVSAELCQVRKSKKTLRAYSQK